MGGSDSSKDPDPSNSNSPLVVVPVPEPDPAKTGFVTPLVGMLANLDPYMLSLSGIK